MQQKIKNLLGKQFEISEILKSRLSDHIDKNLSKPKFEPLRQRKSFKNDKCPFEQTVLAKKINYMNQFYNSNDELSANLKLYSIEYLENVHESIENMYLCNHHMRKHRAKFLCNSCYHSKGNVSMATKCSHTHLPHHARGLCKNCYHRSYYDKKLKY